MRLKELLIILSFFAIASCSTFPKKPICVIEFKSQRLACKIKDDPVITYIPLEQADGYIAVSPDTYESIIEWGQNNCSQKAQSETDK